MQPYYSDESVTLYKGDCREILPQLIGVTALVTDPPYGIRLKTNYGKQGRGCLATSNDFGPGIVGDDEAFDPTHLLGYCRVVLFGANHYAALLPSSPCWLVWDKLDGLTSKREVGFNDQADVEMAWTNKSAPARLFSHRWMGMLKASERGAKRQHPTQKPVALMRWVLQAVTEADDLICDPYAGSGATLLAARELGRRCIGIEIEERYCDVIARRLSANVLPLGEVG